MDKIDRVRPEHRVRHVPVWGASPTYERLASYLQPTKLWSNGMTLRVQLLDTDDPEAHEIVKSAVREGLPPMGLRLEFVSNAPSSVPKHHIRVSFVAGEGNHSYIGTDCLLVPANEPTMNLADVRGRLGRRTILHEFCHALGMLHAHPHGDISWNKPQVAMEVGMTTQELEDNFWPSPPPEAQGQYDPTSIMHYQIPARWTTDGVGINMDALDRLSATDVHYLQTVYPPYFDASVTPPPHPLQRSLDVENMMLVAGGTSTLIILVVSALVLIVLKLGSR